MMKRYLLAALVLAIPGPARADAQEDLHVATAWTFRQADGVDTAVNGEEFGAFDGVCVLEGSTADSSLMISSMPPRLVEMRPDFRGWLAVKISKASWDYRHRHTLATLSVGMASYGDKKANYEGPSIGFSVPRKDFEHFGIFLMFAGGSKSITVLDRRNQVIAQFPADGFAAARDSFLECAGL